MTRAEESLPETKRLLRDARTVLATQAELGGEMRSFSTDLALLAETLAGRDPELRRILRDGGPAARELTALVEGVAPETPRLLSATDDTMTVLVAHLTGVEQALVAFPESLAAAQAGVVNGQAQFSLALTPSPAVCEKGYLPASRWRSPADVSVAPPDYSLACLDPSTTFRGSARSPIAAVVRSSLRSVEW
jgi:phospholipid/cholesterol/gamma-HCH transport system substrate-binding protein